MLIESPIYRELFKIGYQGRKDVYSFWCEHKDVFMTYLHQNRSDLLDSPAEMEAFVAKVRWRSPLGLLMSYELSRAFSQHEFIDLSSYEMPYGNGRISLAEFNELYPAGSETDHKCDLRGISLIQVNMKNQRFVDTDLRYTSVNSSDITNVTFDNCNLSFMNIVRADLNHVDFKENCKMDNVDFSDSLLDSTFHCPVTQPILTRISRSDQRRIIAGFNMRWRKFTDVRTDSFINAVDSTDLKAYIPELQKKVRDACRLRSSSLSARLLGVYRLRR